MYKRLNGVEISNSKIFNIYDLFCFNGYKFLIFSLLIFESKRITNEIKFNMIKCPRCNDILGIFKSFHLYLVYLFFVVSSIYSILMRPFLFFFGKYLFFSSSSHTGYIKYNKTIKEYGFFLYMNLF